MDVRASVEALCRQFLSERSEDAAVLAGPFSEEWHRAYMRCILFVCRRIGRSRDSDQQVEWREWVALRPQVVAHVRDVLEANRTRG